MVVHQSIDNLLAVLGLHLGTLGLLVDDGLALLVQDAHGIEFQGLHAVVIGINQGVAHGLDVHLLAHAAVVHILVILLHLDTVGQRPGLGIARGLLVGECRLQLGEGAVIAVHGHRQAGDGLLGLVHRQMLPCRIQAQQHGKTNSFRKIGICADQDGKNAA